MGWQCGDLSLPVETRPIVMGILNVTPDSFSDGGRYATPARAIEHAQTMIEQGVDVLDIGGESTRPGAAEVDVGDELARVIPVIRELARFSRVAISIDTTKARVAREAMAAGAHIINDISALSADPEMTAVAVDSRAGVVLMHMQGTPRTMQRQPTYDHVVDDVSAYLAERTAQAERQGVARERIAVDPGIGFGKTLEHNLDLLAGLNRIADLGCPVVVGLSRKSFLKALTGKEVNDRLSGSLSALACAILAGAQVLRVHDVAEALDAIRVATAIRDAHTTRQEGDKNRVG